MAPSGRYGGAPVVSIAVCTRDRAAALRDTLECLDRIDVPDGLRVEVVVVDNASVDATREVVTSRTAPRLPTRYVHEARPGVARARNAALAATRGEVVLFLDDDVRPPARWLETMTGPVLSGTADAVAGGVRIPDHLRRPWIEALHATWLASTDYIEPGAPQEMVSANMAIGRHVLARVPRFDPELGPGALGQGEDALFSWQLLRAGFRIASGLHAAAEHHFEERRLLRESFRATAERRGRTLAYVRYHWEHVDVPNPRERWARKALRFLARRLREAPRHRSSEGMATWEMQAREELAFLRRWRVEARRPRQYDRFGLVKRGA